VDINSLVRDLLLRNQKAVIPGFGSFLVQQQPAQLNKITGVLTPPAKEIRFERNMQEDDGLLSGYLMQKHKTSKASAMEFISKFSKNAGEQLRQKGVLLMEGLGTLTVEKSGTVTFKPEDELAKRERFFELPKVNLPVEEKAPSPEPSPERVSPHAGKRSKRRWWIPAALVAFIIGLAALGYNTGVFDRFFTGNKTDVVEMNAKSDDNKLVFGKKAESDSAPAGMDTIREAISHELDERTSRQKALAIEEAKTRPVAASKPVSPAPVQTTPVTTGKPYHIIGGAFRVQNNAERLKASLAKRGFSSELLPRQGDYYMLSLGSYDTHEQATEAMRELRRRLEQEMWVMKK
jgi:nucleoid DNA-binding protein